MESRSQKKKLEDWFLVYILGLCYGLLGSPILAVLFNCILVMCLTYCDPDKTVHFILKLALDAEIANSFNIWTLILLYLVTHKVIVNYLMISNFHDIKLLNIYLRYSV